MNNFSTASRAAKPHPPPKPTRSNTKRSIIRAIIMFAAFILLFSCGTTFLAAQVVASRKGISVLDLLPVAFENLGKIAGIQVGALGQLFLTLLLVFTLEVCAHEGGHVLAGKLVSFRFVMVIIGPLEIRSTERGLRFRRAQESKLTAGAALSVPTTWENLRVRTAMAVVGGPIGSLALGSVALALAFAANSSLNGLFPAVAFFSLTSGVFNLLPLKLGGASSDGARLLMLMRGGPNADRYCFLVAINGISRAGARPRDWSAEWITLITAPADASLGDAAANHVAYYWALDNNDVFRAEMFMGRVINAIGTLPPAIRSAVYADAAFFHAYFRNDLDMARYFIAQAGDNVPVKHQHILLRAQAAVLRAEGKLDEARETARAGLANINREPPDGPGWQLDREWLEALSA